MKIVHLALILLGLGSFSFFIKGDIPKFFAIEKVDDSTKIVAYGGFLDENGKDFNFIIEKPDEIKEFISGIEYGEKVYNVFSEESIEIHVVQNYQDITSLTVIPKYKRVFTNNGYSYQFDLNQLNSWRKKYHSLKYTYKGMDFKTREEFEQFLSIQKQNPDFLYSSRPAFRYEGSFEIQFPKNEKFKNPQAIMDYLKPIINEVEPDEEKYGMSYILGDKNFNNSDQYTITISGSKRIFNELKVDNYKKSNWVLTVENAIFYYKEK
ncbi:MAG: hypothetical protein K0S23_1478 [Fluviicola sp.]|jgi:hypothetical protein|uniref:hypothetical protein n=1 Tax=Fluviicola sp. TaxID=1917219 RepID=UPI00261D21B6|nr:hypothetical protein [Fluviicola sp.]MDF3027171.1 hypothetical protein [Fluviicola sp.]